MGLRKSRCDVPNGNIQEWACPFSVIKKSSVDSVHEGDFIIQRTPNTLLQLSLSLFVSASPFLFLGLSFCSEEEDLEDEPQTNGDASV